MNADMLRLISRIDQAGSAVRDNLKALSPRDRATLEFTAGMSGLQALAQNNYFWLFCTGELLWNLDCLKGDPIPDNPNDIIIGHIPTGTLSNWVDLAAEVLEPHVEGIKSGRLGPSTIQYMHALAASIGGLRLSEELANRPLSENDQ